MDSRPNRRMKAAFSNFSGIMWTGPESSLLVSSSSWSKCSPGIQLKLLKQLNRMLR